MLNNGVINKKSYSLWFVSCHTHMVQPLDVVVNYQFNVYTITMLILILFLVVGSAMVYLAQNNLTLVTLRLGTYVFSGIPLFYIIVGSVLTGLGLSYLIYLVNSIFTAFTLRRKDNKIKQTKSEVVDLTKRIHQLELENERLKNSSTVIEPSDKNAL